MKIIAIVFALIVAGITIFVLYKTFGSAVSILEIGSFITLSLTLIVLVWYAYDTNSIAQITRKRWLREGVLGTSYNFQLVGEKGDTGRTLVQIHNHSTLVVRARVNCNFKIYGQSVSGGPAYDGGENWILFPLQMSQGWFEINSLLQMKGKTVDQMITEFTQANLEEQLTMTLELEFWDELGTRRVLPRRFHYFDFNRWAWIPRLTER